MHTVSAAKVCFSLSGYIFGVRNRAPWDLSVLLSSGYFLYVDTCASVFIFWVVRSSTEWKTFGNILGRKLSLLIWVHSGGYNKELFRERSLNYRVNSVLTEIGTAYFSNILQLHFSFEQRFSFICWSMETSSISAPQRICLRTDGSKILQI
jgi:hypothetical protein